MNASLLVRRLLIGLVLATFVVTAAEARPVLPECTDLFRNLLLCQ